MQYVASAAYLLTVYSNYLSTSNAKLNCPDGQVDPSDVLKFAKSQVQNFSLSSLNSNFRTLFFSAVPQFLTAKLFRKTSRPITSSARTRSLRATWSATDRTTRPMCTTGVPRFRRYSPYRRQLGASTDSRTGTTTRRPIQMLFWEHLLAGLTRTMRSPTTARTISTPSRLWPAMLLLSEFSRSWILCRTQV